MLIMSELPYWHESGKGYFEFRGKGFFSDGIMIDGYYDLTFGEVSLIGTKKFKACMHDGIFHDSTVGEHWADEQEQFDSVEDAQRWCESIFEYRKTRKIDERGWMTMYRYKDRETGQWDLLTKHRNDWMKPVMARVTLTESGEYVTPLDGQPIAFPSLHEAQAFAESCLTLDGLSTECACIHYDDCTGTSRAFGCDCDDCRDRAFACESHASSLWFNDKKQKF